MDPDDHLGPLLEDIRRNVSLINISFRQPRFYELIAARSGVSLPASQMRTLARIGEHDGLRTTDVADILAIDVTTASRFVRALADDGLIERHPVAADGRSATLALTPAGRGALDRLLEAWHSVIHDVVADWSLEDLDAFRAQLNRFGADLGAFRAAYLAGDVPGL